MLIVYYFKTSAECLLVDGQSRRHIIIAIMAIVIIIIHLSTYIHMSTRMKTATSYDKCCCCCCCYRCCYCYPSAKMTTIQGVRNLVPAN